jgi:tyrosine-protein kinase Etk/Wzc
VVINAMQAVNTYGYGGYGYGYGYGYYEGDKKADESLLKKVFRKK